MQYHGHHDELLNKTGAGEWMFSGALITNVLCGYLGHDIR